MNLAEWLKIIVPACVIVLGWAVVHRLAKERERAILRGKVLARHCDATIERANSIRELAAKYHLEARNVQAERRLLASFTDLGIMCSAFDGFAVPSITSNAVLIAQNDFKIAATGFHFQDEHVQPEPPDSEKLADIDVCCAVLSQLVLQVKVTMLTSKADA
jgi:hypothetical protein